MNHIPVKWTSEQIREIVRDEITKIDDEKTAVAAAKMSVFRAGFKSQLEEHINDMDVPEHLRANVRLLAEKLIGD